MSGPRILRPAQRCGGGSDLPQASTSPTTCNSWVAAGLPLQRAKAVLEASSLQQSWRALIWGVRANKGAQQTFQIKFLHSTDSNIRLPEFADDDIRRMETPQTHR